MSMTSESQVYFEQNATQWDALRTGYFPEAVREAAIARAYLRPEMEVADVGGGTGFMSAGLAPLVGRVHLVDGSAPMIDVARRNLAGFANVTYHHSDGATLPFADGSLDAVFANMYLHHCSDPLVAVREMVRVLKPGGRLLITDLDLHPYEWLREEMADVWQGFDREQLRAWYHEAGLVNVFVACTGEACCAESADATLTDTQDRKAQISVFVAVGTRSVTGTTEAVAAGYTERAEATGSCSCGAPQPFEIGYDALSLAAIPEETAALSLGCGNPIGQAKLQPGEAVLDLGSGGGIDALLAARAVGPTGKVIGLDMTPAMLAHAREAARKAGVSHVEFREGRIESMPIADASIDVILSNCVINLADDKGRVFSEAARVLKPAGRLVVSDIVTGGPLPSVMRTDPEQWAGCVAGALPESEYLDLLAEAGFTSVQAERGEVRGEFEGVPVYSLYVKATRDAEGGSCGCSKPSVKENAVAPVPSRGCCGS